MKTILITGGSGLVGRKLSKMLIAKDYRVIWLSRERHVKGEIPRYRWDYRNGEIDEEAILRADIIVHLAGKNIGDDKWNKHTKKTIVESRVKSADLIFQTLKKKNKKIDAFISASAVGYYGAKVSDRIYTEEDDLNGDDFLSRTCREWEAAADKFNDELKIRTVKLRSGFVVSKNSDAFKKMVLPTRLGLGSPLGKGNQYMSWIHVNDLCRIYIKAIEDATMSGVYNAVAPEYITNENFMYRLARALKRPFFMPNVPAIFMRLIMGEAAEMILGGSRISAEKIEKTGFSFEYRKAKKALKSVIKSINEKEKRQKRRA